ncbi:Pre-rRNA-processing protein ipi3 [Ceratobasidium sp. 414]|nr:Pre-rRNA-processing protein ipi3 [Ceratobasidium sp. 414]
MLNSWEAHFRRVHVLKFTGDDAALVSASEDSAVSVWSVASLVDIQLQHELPAPHCNLPDHTLPVLDVACGSGMPSLGLMLPCISLTQRIKLWDLSSPSKPLLTTFTLPRPIQMVVMDSAQRVIFAAAASGEIHRVSLFKPAAERPGRGANETMVAVGGGRNDSIRVAEAGQPEIVVGQPITSLNISLTSSLLLVGTASGVIHVYDIESLQLLRSITTHRDKGLSVIYLKCMLKPIDLQGHATIGDGGASAKELIPLRPVVPFQRMRDPKAREAHEPMMMILPGLEGLPPPGEDAELLAGQAYFLGSNTHQSTGAGQHIVNSRVAELEAELARLRTDLGKAKGINDSMWEMVVNTMLPKTNGSTSDAELEADFMVIDGAPQPGAANVGDVRKRSRK